MVQFVIDVVVDPRQTVGGTRRIQGEFRGLETAAGRLKRTFAGLFAFVGIGAATTTLIRFADTFTTVQNRLRTVTDGTEELGAATDALFRISNRTRQSFESTAELYARVGLAAQDLGRSQNELLQFTESVNQAVQLSGASATEASAGLIQLAQGLGSGALRGDELRSVLEQLPVVADVIADSLGVTRGELRKLGEEGKISAEIVLDAFKEARVELDERFGEAVPTVGQAFTVFRNNVLESIGALDQATGATTALAGLIILFAENLDIAAGAIIVLAIAILSSYVPATISATVVTKAFIASLAGLAKTAAFTTGVFAAVGVAAVVAANRIAQEFDKAQAKINEAAEAGEKFALTEFGKVGADIERVRGNLERLEEKFGDNIESNAAAANQAQRYREQLQFLTNAQNALRDGTAASTVEARQQAQALEDLQAAVDGVVASIEVENGLLQESARERTIQRDLLREIARLEKESGLEVTPEQEAAIELALRTNQALSDRAAVLERIQGPQAQFQADLEQLGVLLESGTIDQEQYNAELARMVAGFEGLNAAGVEEILGDLELPEGVTERLRAYIAEVERLRNQGLDPSGGGGLFPTRQADDFNASLERIRETSANLSGELTTGLERGFSRIVDQVTDVSGAVENLLVNAFNNAEDALVEFVTTGEFDFSKFVDGLIEDIARLIVKILILKAIEAIGGGGGGAAGDAAGALTGAAQSGGDFPAGRPILVGEEGPEIFTPAGGGTVTPAGETAARMSAAASAPPTVNVAPPSVMVVNVNDPSEIPSGIESADGEAAVMNVIRRRRREVKGITG